jgi:hypothetical protein
MFCLKDFDLLDTKLDQCLHSNFEFVKWLQKYVRDSHLKSVIDWNSSAALEHNPGHVIGALVFRGTLAP